MSMDRKIEKKKWTLKRIAMLAGAGAFLLLVLYGFFFRDASSRLNVESERITISEVQRGPFQEYIPITGTIIPIKTIYLDAVEGGRVEKVYIEAGSNVKQGDKILQLTNTNMLMDVMYREAELFQQDNNLRNTRLAMEQNRLSLRAGLVDLDYQIKRLERAYHRDDELLKKNLIALQQYQDTKDQYEYNLKRRELAMESFVQDSVFRNTQIHQLEASLERMKQNLALVKRNMENLTLRAPVDGQLTSLNAEIGELKSPGERLGQVDIMDGFKVRANVDEHYLARVGVGLAGEFEFADNTHRVMTQKVFPEISEGRFEVDMIFVDAEPEGIRRGQTAHIRLQLGDPSQAILLPRGGFYQQTGGQWVFVVNKSGDLAVKRAIRLGRQNPQVFEVLEGLELGDRVITSSYDNFGEIEKLVLKK
jgi:HlyD family secretion protein